ncbi:MAG: hypothetical protein ACT4PE_05555 [Candidatus Eiseniibacteriota bacterium]
MPVAPVMGRGARRPAAFTSYEIADSPSQQLMRPRTAMPGGVGRQAAPGGARSGARTAAPAGSSPWSVGALSQFGGDVRRAGWQPGQPLPGGLRMPGGTTTPAPSPGAPWDPNDPFGGAVNLLDPIRALIAKGGREGVFGQNYLVDRLRPQALRNANAGRTRTATLAGLSGLDPMQYRGALVDADISANQGMVGALNEAQLQGDMGYRQMLLDLLNRERYGVEAPGESANIDRRFQESQRGGIGGFLGGVLGTGLGALTGGLGSGLGARLAGGSGLGRMLDDASIYNPPTPALRR